MQTKLLPQALAILGLLAPFFAHAMTPLTPRLTPQSHQELVIRLTELGFPQVAHNSVLIALTQVLGLKPESKSYDYDPQPYPHLPRVQVSASPDAAGCTIVALHATYQRPQPGRVRLQPIYGPSGVGLWQAKQQVPTPEP